MLRVLIELWPVSLPILIYLSWHLLRTLKARKAQEEVPGLWDGPWMWAFIASIAIAAALLFAFGLSVPQNRGDYTPPALINGQVAPARITPHE